MSVGSVIRIFTVRADDGQLYSLRVTGTYVTLWKGSPNLPAQDIEMDYISRVNSTLLNVNLAEMDVVVHQNEVVFAHRQSNLIVRVKLGFNLSRGGELSGIMPEWFKPFHIQEHTEDLLGSQVGDM